MCSQAQIEAMLHLEAVQSVDYNNLRALVEGQTNYFAGFQFIRYENLPVLDNNGIPVDLYQYSKFVASSRSEQKIIRARVPVRVSYSGGGTDMSSYINKIPATVLSSTINKYCTASVIIRNDDEIHISSKDLGLSYGKFESIKASKITPGRAASVTVFRMEVVMSWPPYKTPGATRAVKGPYRGFAN